MRPWLILLPLSLLLEHVGKLLQVNSLEVEIFSVESHEG
jgi:hypothetical protein